MKYSMARHLLLCISFFVFVNQIGGLVLGQGDVGYWAHRPNLPAEVTSVNVRDFALTTDGTGKADFALVVGISDRTDRENSPFVYDHFGFIDPDSTFDDPDPSQPNPPIPGKLWDIEDLVGPNPVPGYPAYDQGVFYGVNSSGLVCGWFVSSTLSGESRLPVYLDLTEPVLQLRLIPLPLEYEEYVDLRADRINELGDILVMTRQVSGGPWEPYIFDSVNETGIPVTLQLSDPVDIRFNSLRQIIGVRDDGNVVRHSTGGATEVFPELRDAGEINDFGQFVSALYINKGRDKGDYGVRIGLDRSEERRWSPPLSAFNYRQDYRINENGDALDQTANTDDAYYFHEGDPSISGDEVFYESVIDLVIPESDPGNVFRNSGLDESAFISDRDSTGFGWIATDSYSGVNADGSSKLELYLLIPMVPTPTPGISVTPSVGLLTTEAGGTDSFDVVLNTQPIADVTIGISSSDIGEGLLEVEDPSNPGETLLVDSYDLVFDSTNWHMPQTVTITGVDDPFEDGNVAYTIHTALATSTDPAYDGIDADDVSVVNKDDDSPPGGGSETYSSDDTPRAIPDFPNPGIESTITVDDDFTIIGLTVTLNISHPRPDDLDVYLVGPDDQSVLLENFSGDNPVTQANFLEISTSGDWTLELYDSRKKRTGTLHSWSITVDY